MRYSKAKDRAFRLYQIWSESPKQQSIDEYYRGSTVKAKPFKLGCLGWIGIIVLVMFIFSRL